VSKERKGKESLVQCSAVKREHLKKRVDGIWIWIGKKDGRRFVQWAVLLGRLFATWYTILYVCTTYNNIIKMNK